jgi:hypothetical protein
LNVISLFNKTIPLIAIQIQALQVGQAEFFKVDESSGC